MWWCGGWPASWPTRCSSSRWESCGATSCASPQPWSVGAAPAEDRAEGPCRDREIEPEAATLHVVGLEQQSLLERAVRAAVHLPQAGDPRTYREQLGCLGTATQLVHEVRSRADEAHLAEEDVRQLR